MTSAADGGEALQLWNARRAAFDLVISDMIMPGGMSGAELLARVGRDDPSVRTLLMSGYGATEGDGQGPPLLQKPFTVDTFVDAVSNALNRP